MVPFIGSIQSRQIQTQSKLVLARMWWWGNRGWGMTTSWVGGFPSSGDGYITLWMYSVSLRVNFMLCIFHHNGKSIQFKIFFFSCAKESAHFQIMFIISIEKQTTLFKDQSLKWKVKWLRLTLLHDITSSVRELGIKWTLKSPTILCIGRLFCGTSGIHRLSVTVDIFV